MHHCDDDDDDSVCMCSYQSWNQCDDDGDDGGGDDFNCIALFHEPLII